MAEIPPLPHTIGFNRHEFGHHPELLSNLGDTHPGYLYHPHFHPSPPNTSFWQPTTTDASNPWNTPPGQGTFPPALIGPGYNPSMPPRPELDPDRVSTSSVNARKRKRAAPSAPVETPSAGGYGPIFPGSTSPGTDPPSPSPPPLTLRRRRNAADDVWAFAQPLASNAQPPGDQWPTSLEPCLARKPKSLWFGCKLCLQFRYLTYLSALGNITLISVC